MQSCMPKRIGTRFLGLVSSLVRQHVTMQKISQTHAKPIAKYICWRLMFHHFCGDVLYMHFSSSSSAWTFLFWIHHSACLWLGACVSHGHTHTHIFIYIYIHIRAYTYTYLHIDVMATDTYQYVKISTFHIFACVSLTNHWLLLAGHDEAGSAWCNSFLLSLSPPPLSALSETPGSWDSWACLGPNTCHVCQNRCRIECPNRCQQVR